MGKIKHNFEIFLYMFFIIPNYVYWLSADLSGWFYMKRKSRKTFDIMSTKYTFFKFRLGGGFAARHLPPALPGCANGHIDGL